MYGAVRQQELPAGLSRGGQGRTQTTRQSLQVGPLSPTLPGRALTAGVRRLVRFGLFQTLTVIARFLGIGCSCRAIMVRVLPVERLTGSMPLRRPLERFRLSRSTVP